MSNPKLLLVEDEKNDIAACLATVSRYRKEKNRDITIIQAARFSDAMKVLDSSFDGAIVDLRLDTEGEGNEVIREIRAKFRIPVAVMTGTPQDAQSDVPYLGVFTKGETGYDELLDLFCLTYDTGITKILGGRGYLEEAMDRVFWDSILPHLEKWKQYREKGKNTEEALLRFVVNHIVEIVDNDVEKYFPEEMYIGPITSNALKTGSIVKNRETNNYHVVLSPACDLVIYDDKPKTDRILLCLIEPFYEIADREANKNKKLHVAETDDEKTKAEKGRNKEKEKQGKLNSLPDNKIPYYHYLPETKIFQGGVINFRHVETVNPNEYKNSFGDPVLQISAAFTKDIVARFASYYARQGQPDFDLG